MVTYDYLLFRHGAFFKIFSLYSFLLLLEFLMKTLDKTLYFLESMYVFVFVGMYQYVTTVHPFSENKLIWLDSPG